MPYDPHQPRVPAGESTGGQWLGGNVSRKHFDRLSPRDKMDHIKAGGSVSDDHINELFERITQPDGGFTYQPLTDDEPTEGFAVSIHPERSFAVDADRLTYEHLVNYVAKNRDLIASHENYLGAWHDPDTHKVFLDISTVTRDAARATKLARDHDQIAYFDLKSKRSITVNRSATSGGVA